MPQVEIENLLYKAMGLDTASIGSAAIERAVSTRMAKIGVSNLADYWQKLNSSAEEIQELIEAVVVPETWFFRHRESFTALNRFVCDEWLPTHPWAVLRVLSMPCSTGEEPYSIAMSLLDAGVARDRFSVEAWDISQQALARAQRATYTRNSFRGEDLHFRERYFQCEAGIYHITESVRSQVSFRQVNLLDQLAPSSLGRYDIVFCRNVLIYFDRTNQQQAIDNLKALLTSDGITFVGPAEALLMRAEGFAPTNAPMSFSFKRSKGASLSSGLAVPTKPHTKPLPRLPLVSNAKPTPKLLPIAQKPSSLPSMVASTVAANLADSETARLEKVRQLADAGKVNEAAQMCETYLREHGDSAEGHYLMGIIRDASGDTQGATQSYRKALYLNPNHAEAIVHLALLAEQRGDATEAKRLYERARRANQTGKNV